MRKLIAWLLLAVFGMPLASPLLAMTPGGVAMMACCRKGGRHDCAGVAMRGMAGMSMAAEPASGAPHAWSAPRECCPMSVASVGAMHIDFLPTGMVVRTEAAALRTQGRSQEHEGGVHAAVLRRSQPRGPPVSRLSL